MKKLLSHTSLAVLEAGLIAMLVAGLMVGTAFAGRGGGGGGKHGGGGSTGGSGTIALHIPLDVDHNGNGTANWSDVVSFDIATSSTTQPWVHLVCSQGGTVVAQGWAGYFDGALGGRTFGLASPSWPGGAADCVARLETGTGSLLGSTSFHVDA